MSRMAVFYNKWQISLYSLLCPKIKLTQVKVKVYMSKFTQVLVKVQAKKKSTQKVVLPNKLLNYSRVKVMSYLPPLPFCAGQKSGKSLCCTTAQPAMCWSLWFTGFLRALTVFPKLISYLHTQAKNSDMGPLFPFSPLLFRTPGTLWLNGTAQVNNRGARMHPWSASFGLHSERDVWDNISFVGTHVKSCWVGRVPISRRWQNQRPLVTENRDLFSEGKLYCTRQVVLKVHREK